MALSFDSFLKPTAAADFSGVVLDCRFDLADPSAGKKLHTEGHIPGAQHMDLEDDLASPVAKHGGRHPLPPPAQFAGTLARLGIGLDTDVLLYDDSRFAFAARCWWMMTALGYQSPLFLAGGFKAWRSAGLPVETGEVLPAIEMGSMAKPSVPDSWPGVCVREEVREHLANGAILVDAREPRRYLGEFEPIDPIAGHIPGAINHPWQEFSDDLGNPRDGSGLMSQWSEIGPDQSTVVYCGSGVTACVNALSLQLSGCKRPVLYAGSWSDWCSYLPQD
ncbi:MAG: sulfurtransferase [Pseudomonadota bacterium]